MQDDMTSHDWKIIQAVQYEKDGRWYYDLGYHTAAADYFRKANDCRAEAAAIKSRVVAQTGYR